MRLTIALAVLLPALSHAVLVQAAGDRFLTVFQCPHAEIMCLEKVGYNYQICGTLTGVNQVSQEFPLCPATDRAACVPCWFSSVAATSGYCRAKYGTDCGHFIEHNSNYKGEWSDLDWPDLTPFYSLWRNSPLSDYSE